MSIHNPVIEINGRKIGINYPTYFIADIAANHDGNLQRAIDLIRLAKAAGADAAKFQHFNAETIVSDFGFRSLDTNASHQSSWNKSVFQVYKEASISLDWTEILKKTCDEVGIHFFSSPYSMEMVDHINPYVPAFKIGSGDITWDEIVEYVASKNKPYLIATGASDMKEVIHAVNLASSINSNLALLQCNTNYTGSAENLKFVNLNVLTTYAKLFPNMVLGLSDHTFGSSTVMGAVALGARIIEKHFTDDVSRVGPDHKFSMDPISWAKMVCSVRELENALGDGQKRCEENEKNAAVVQRRAIRASVNIASGEVISKSSLEILRPCPIDAIPLSELTNVIGRRASREILRGEYLRREYIL